jgi:hypothetical protein
MKKNIFIAIIATLVIGFFLSGCVEHHYYQQNHRHSEGYNHRHHRTSSELDVRIHN